MLSMGFNADQYETRVHENKISIKNTGFNMSTTTYLGYNDVCASKLEVAIDFKNNFLIGNNFVNQSIGH